MNERSTGDRRAGDRSPGDASTYECGECDNVAFADPEATCCGESMTPVEADAVIDPELEVVLREVFGISETGLHVCLCLMEHGESTTSEIADRLGIDRSTVTRQLNHLTDVGVLDKHQRLLEGGGYVNVYSPEDVETVRERLTAGVYEWTNEALELVEHVNREKLDALARADGEGGTREGGDGDANDESSIYWDG
jgi:predicted transcriptional regulator